MSDAFDGFTVRPSKNCREAQTIEVGTRVIQNGAQLVQVINALNVLHASGMMEEFCENCNHEMCKVMRRAMVEAERLNLLEMSRD